MEKPVFIIGLHRAGSTLVNDVLNLNPGLAMAPDEMQLFWPLTHDFLDHAKKIGDLQNNANISKIVDLIYSGEMAGSFWKEWRKLGIPKEKVLQRIEASDRSYRSIINILLEEYANQENKQRYGAKYLVHFNKTDVLLDWYPDCKIVHITRDSRAICASKVNDLATRGRKKKYFFIKPFIHWGTILFFCWQYILSAKIHVKYNNYDNYFFLRYEDLIVDPLNTIKKLCKFLELEFSEKMMFPKGKSSSFTREKNRGFDMSRISYWREKMSGFDIKLITLFTKRAMLKLGYEDINREYGKLESEDNLKEGLRGNRFD